MADGPSGAAFAGSRREEGYPLTGYSFLLLLFIISYSIT